MSFLVSPPLHATRYEVPRSLPDAADGLTELERRILHALAEEVPTAPPGRCQTTRILERVLETAPSLEEHLGKEDWRDTNSPHVAAYAAVIDLAVAYRTRYPLIDYAGNFGSRDGRPADHFYNECRLSRWGQAVLERSVPNLLVNGARAAPHGALHFVPRNLRKVTDVLVAVIAGSSAREVVANASSELAPDFPTGGVLAGVTPSVVQEGRGTVRLRAWVRVEPIRSPYAKDADPTPCVLVSNLPEDVDRRRFTEQACSLVMSRQLGGATDAWELPDGDSIAFPTAPGARIERVEAAVRAQLPLEAEITVDGLAVVAGRTHRLGLLELVEHAAASQIARERDRMPAADDITLRNAAIAHLRAVAEEHGDDPRSS